MQADIAHIFRHPVKSLGEEAVDAVTLTAGRHMPFDRMWAVAHGGSEYDPAAPDWRRSRNFVIQTENPRLAQIRCSYDEAAQVLTLSHPDLSTISLDPDDAAQAATLTDWIGPLAQDMRPGPYVIAKAPDQGMTDFPDTHIAIGSLRSLKALEDLAGRTLEKSRFRMNLWIDGTVPWEEFDLLDREITVGTARLAVTARVKRCNATTANPQTGARDVQVPAILNSQYGHMDFGVYAQVIGDGEVRRGDALTLG